MIRRWPLLAVLLASCTVGPRYRPPHATLPPHFGAEPQTPGLTYAGAVNPAWWQSFHDPILSSLIARLGRQNLDLRIAAERIRQAGAQIAVVASQALPHLGAAAQYTHERESPNGILSLIEPTPGAPLEFDVYQPQATASWEIDLFGRVRRAAQAQRQELQAQIYARRAVALAAMATLARDYMQLRETQAAQAVLTRSVALTAQRDHLVRLRYQNGVATMLDVAQADAEVSRIGQDLPGLRAQQAALINAIGLLLAQPPRALAPQLAPPAPQPSIPPSVPVGLPSQLLRRRPDIAQAEARLHAATDRTGVAVADFFPDLTISADFGYQSLKTFNLFDWASRIYMISPTLTIPIFEGGRLRGELRLRRSEQRAAAIDYDRTVLNSLREVDDALTAYAQAQLTLSDTRDTLADDSRALTAAQQQYREGATDFLNVIAAQDSLLQSQQAVVRGVARVESQLVTLYEALGGGWS